MRNFKGFVKKSVSLILSIGVIFSLQTFTYAAVHKPATDTVYTEYLPSDSNPVSQESMSTEMSMDKNKVKEVTAEIIKAAEAGQKSVNVSQYDIDKDEVLPIYSNFLSETPYLFRINHSYYSYRYKNNKVTQIEIPYNNYTDEQLNKMKTELDDAVDKAVKQTSTAKTDLEKATALYDYLVLNTTYNYKALTMSSVFESAYSPYGALVQKNAVCAGIASAYKLLLNKVGIPCDVVTSIAQNHEWNAVKIGNNYYNADPTFDISKSYIAFHDYFLKSDNYFFNHMHNGWKINGISYDINSSPYENWHRFVCDTTFVNMDVGDKYTFYLETNNQKPSFLYNNKGLKVEVKAKNLYKITALKPGNYYLTIVSDGNWWTDMLVNVK